MHLSKFKSIALLSAAGILTSFANAMPVFVNGTDAGSQYGYLLGMDFEVKSAITVTHMGVFDAGEKGFDGSLQVGIFSLGSLTQSPTNSLVAGSSVTFSGSADDPNAGLLDGGSRFRDVADFVLLPGYYSIVAVGFTSKDKSGNTGLSGTTSFNDLGGSLSVVPGGGRWTQTGSTTLALPTAKYGGYEQSDPVFQAGTFKATVPDGGITLILLGLGLAGLAVGRRFLKA